MEDGITRLAGGSTSNNACVGLMRKASAEHDASHYCINFSFSPSAYEDWKVKRLRFISLKNWIYWTGNLWERKPNKIFVVSRAGKFSFFLLFFCKCVEDVSDISESRKKFFAFLPASVLYHHRVETFTRLRIKSSFEEKNRQEYFRIESLPYEIKGAE